MTHDENKISDLIDAGIHDETMQYQHFIGEYLQKYMKNYKGEYDMAYLNKLAKVEEAAERAWKRKQLKQS